jgi:hypothetical protein
MNPKHRPEKYWLVATAAFQPGNHTCMHNTHTRCILLTVSKGNLHTNLACTVFVASP